MAVVPLEFEGVLADGCDFDRARWVFVHHEEGLGFGLRLSGLAAGLIAFFVAGGAGAGVAQPAEVPVTLVAIAPVDLDAGAFGLLDADLLRRDSICG